MMDQRATDGVGRLRCEMTGQYEGRPCASAELRRLLRLNSPSGFFSWRCLNSSATRLICSIMRTVAWCAASYVPRWAPLNFLPCPEVVLGTSGPMRSVRERMQLFSEQEMVRVCVGARSARPFELRYGSGDSGSQRRGGASTSGLRLFGACAGADEAKERADSAKASSVTRDEVACCDARRSGWRRFMGAMGDEERRGATFQPQPGGRQPATFFPTSRRVWHPNSAGRWRSPTPRLSIGMRS